jgi:hypothetical protein
MRRWTGESSMRLKPCGKRNPHPTAGFSASYAVIGDAPIQRGMPLCES